MNTLNTLKGKERKKRILVTNVTVFDSVALTQAGWGTCCVWGGGNYMYIMNF